MSASRKIKYDPLVSDAACHTRAPYLVYLSRKSKISTLSKNEQDYLEACELLTETQSRKLDAFGVIVDERTDLAKIPARYIQPTASNTQKNTFLAKKKSEVANTTLQFLQEGCKDLKLSAQPELLTFHIPSSKQYIPVLPLYVSAKMMLHYAAKQNIPLVVNLKRLTLVETKFLLDGAAALTYTFDSKNNNFALFEPKEDQDVIAIDMVSCYVKNTENEVNGFLASSTFKVFMETFCKEDVAALIMICAVGHPQYPSTAEPPKLKKESPNSDISSTQQTATTFPAASVSSEDKTETTSSIKISLDECCEAEYKQLAALARRYGFFRPNAQYTRIDHQKQKLVRTNTCLPFYIDHVYASTLKECQQTTAALMERQTHLLEEQEVNLNPDKTARNTL